MSNLIDMLDTRNYNYDVNCQFVRLNITYCHPIDEINAPYRHIFVHDSLNLPLSTCIALVNHSVGARNPCKNIQL